jgi:uncharacterized protein YuzE
VKVHYDKVSDAAYIQIASGHPEGAVEMDETLIVHTGAQGEILGFEILDASKRLPVRSLYRLEVLMDDNPRVRYQG